jgi:hypothetical protein
LASVSVVDGTIDGDRYAIWRESQKLGLSNGRTPKLGVKGLILPVNTLRKRTGFPLEEGKEAMPELPAFKELVKGLSSRVNIRPLGGAVL